MDISKTNRALIEQIKRKIAKKTNSKTFDKHIDLIKNSITKLRTFNEHLNLLSPDIKTLPQLKKAVVLQNRQAKQLKEQAKENKLIIQGLRSIDVGSQKAIGKALDVLKPLKDVKVKHLNMIYRGKQKVMQITVKHDQMRRDYIQQYVNDVSKSLKRNGMTGIIEVSLRYEYGWRTGKQVIIGNSINLYNEIYEEIDEQNFFDEFVIYILQDNNIAEGGASDNNNDCLYDCLKTILGDGLPWESPTAFKKFLKVPRCAKIGIDRIEEIENKLNNISINITGDFIYTSKLNATKIINLKLCNMHYTNDYNKENKKVKNISYRNRNPVIYDNRTLMCYDGKTEFKLTPERRTQIYQWETDYILINKKKTTMTIEQYERYRFNRNGDLKQEYKKFVETKKIDKSLTLTEQYDLFIHDADILLKETEGLINLYKTGDELNTALNLFDRYTKHIANPPKINQIEATFISKCKGAIIFGQTYKGPLYKYDVKSMYPSIQNSKQLFPIKEGELLYLTNNEFINSTFYKYGIYRAKVSKSDINTNKLFRYNDDNYYTHIDLTRAKELGLKIDLIVDNQVNFIYYTRDKLLCGTEIFGQFVNTMYEFKQRKLPRCKSIINILWGGLSEKKIKKKYISDSSELFKLPNDTELCYLKPSLYNDGETIVEFSYNDTQFKFGWGRIMPFLISKSKVVISKIIEPYKLICVRSHTDSMLLTEEPVGLKTGNNIGEIAYEGYSDNCEVLNSMRVIGEFTL